MKFTRTKQMRHWVGHTPAILMWSLGGAALIALAVWALYAIMLWVLTIV